MTILKFTFFFKSWRYNLGVRRFWQENFEFGTF